MGHIIAYPSVAIVFFIGGLIIGALIWRNNAKRFEDLEKKGQETLNALRPE